MPKRLPSRTSLVRQLDALFSLKIRARDQRVRGKCPFHHMSVRPIEQCFHFITRAKQSVRWDDRNACGSCAACNIRYEHDQTFVDFVFDWYKETYGEIIWDQLKRDANIIVHRSRTDLMEMVDLLKEELGVKA